MIYNTSLFTSFTSFIFVFKNRKMIYTIYQFFINQILLLHYIYMHYYYKQLLAKETNRLK